MKSLYLAISCLIFLSTFSLAQTSAYLLEQQLQQKSLEKQPLPAGISQDWYQSAMKKIEEREYNFKALGLPGEFGAFNRRQELGFKISSKGYEIKNFDTKNSLASSWSANFKIIGIGRNNYIKSISHAPKTKFDPLHLEFAYAGFRVDYINDKSGMRQNFIVDSRPAGNGNLKVAINLKSSLKAMISGNSQLVLHEKGNKKDIKLIYDQLKVWDASGQMLSASMEISNTDELTILVNDKAASYPITIDPLNHGPDWTDSGNGLLFPALTFLDAPLLFGFSVSGAGDVNNDNFDDLIVGAPAYVDILTITNGGGTFTAAAVGAAFIYYGSGTGPSINPSEALQPTSTVGALFGFSVSKAGDINKDGFDDVVIGAPGDVVNLTLGTFPLTSIVSAGVGKVYVYYGSSFDNSVTTEPIVGLSLALNQADFGVLVSTPANPLYGFSVSNAGDVNGDTYDDIVVGSPAYASLIPLTLGGRVDVYLGSNTGLGTTPHKIIGSLVGGLFGFSVSTAGKVNNDIYDDIIAGAPASLGLLPVAAGKAYVFHGSSIGITAANVAAADATLTAPTNPLLSQTLFGYSVSNAGDVNGDGRGDVIVGEPFSVDQLLSLQLIAVGKAHIFYGSATGVQTTGFTSLTSPRNPGILSLVPGNLLFGFSVSSAGDLNCDTFADVLIGEPGGTALSLNSGLLGTVSTNAISGKAYVYYGRATKPINSPSYQLQETGALSIANLIGTSVSDAGDVNGDGRADFVVGAPNGTLNLGTSITGLVGSALNIITQNSVGSAYAIFGCFTNTDLDFDNDGIPDAVDLDDDNDGIPDLSEYPGLGLTQDPSGDLDGDGIPNYKDVDFTGCGGLNGAGTCAAFDRDGDGVPNSFDLDGDNDGIPDVIEAGGVDDNGDGVLDNFTDTDNDGLSQSVDANNTGGSGSGNGLGTPDFDGDGIPNAADIDSDGDGITDVREAGLPDANNDGLIDGFGDTDGDGFANSADPKEGHFGASDPAGAGTPALTTPADINGDGHFDGNPTVTNLDNDTQYNFLDLDSDNDGITDNVEGQSTLAYLLPATADTDGDGLADVYDSQGGNYTAGGIIPNNQDGTDSPDYLDTDTDNDGQLDIVEGHDTNLNGRADDDITLIGLDSDKDGIDDGFDLAVGPNSTNQGMANPPIPGARGPVQSLGGGQRDWRNNLVALPLQLISFNASEKATGIELKWKTDNEINSSHFEIEKSTDGVHFSNIGTVKATGGGDYSFTDASPASGSNIYRLKIVDIDKKFVYSKVLNVILANGPAGIQLFPNPAKDQVQLVWRLMQKGTYKIEMINTAGQVIQTNHAEINSNNQVMQITRGNNWKSGLYMIRITNRKSGLAVLRKLMVE